MTTFVACDICGKKMPYEDLWGWLSISESSPQGWLFTKHYCSKEHAKQGVERSTADPASDKLSSLEPQ